VAVEPDQGLRLRLQTKQPGPQFHLRSSDLKFSYRQAYGRSTPSAYETLLLDVLQNDPTLFMRFDQVEAAWQILQPVLDARAALPAVGFPNYPAGSWGPATSAALTASDGRNWMPPEGLSTRGRAPARNFRRKGDDDGD
jgi:glucose-6-phosphate 1-dehydrogenase